MSNEQPLPNSFLKARRALLLDHPFFGSLILRLTPVIDPDCKTIWTDGTRLGFDPAFFDALPQPEAAGVLAHEILHCALEHHLRRGSREAKLWNDSCDYVINPMVKKSGLPLPANTLSNPAYEGKSAEEVYSMLNTQKPKPEEGDGNRKGKDTPQPTPQQGTGAGNSPSDSPGGQNNPQTGPKPPQSAPTPNASGAGQGSPSEGQGGAATGEVRDGVGEDGQAPSPAETQAQSDEWKIAVQQAVNNAKGQGFFPAELERVVTEILKPKVDWREELRRFFQNVTRTESTWMRPNRRFIGQGLYLPGMRSEAAGPLVVAIDTSGSIGAKVLEQFAGELTAIIEDTQPERVYVVYCDARINGVAEFTVDDLPLELHPRGGGGTDFRPVFEWVESAGIQPDCLVYLTDMFGSFPQQEPGYPVLWGSTSHVDKAPFGDVISIKEIF